MYSFNPLPPVTPDHGGFVIICVFMAIMLFLVIFNDSESFFVAFFFATVVVGFSYCVSYIWTDQTVKYYPNEKVTATFVKFEAEGYKERSGKSYVDRHFTYVVYNVNGNNILMYAKEGLEYPKTAILYKN